MKWEGGNKWWVVCPPAHNALSPLITQKRFLASHSNAVVDLLLFLNESSTPELALEPVHLFLQISITLAMTIYIKQNLKENLFYNFDRFLTFFNFFGNLLHNWSRETLQILVNFSSYSAIIYPLSNENPFGFLFDRFWCRWTGS